MMWSVKVVKQDYICFKNILFHVTDQLSDDLHSVNNILDCNVKMYSIFPKLFSISPAIKELNSNF